MTLPDTFELPDGDILFGGGSIYLNLGGIYRLQVWQLDIFEVAGTGDGIDYRGSLIGLEFRGLEGLKRSRTFRHLQRSQPVSELEAA